MIVDLANAQRLLHRSLLALSLCFSATAPAALAQAPAVAPPGETCDPSVLAIDGNRIWARKAGKGATTVVFEAGFGNDSTVWAAIESRIRAAGVQTLVYDRAGMGQSVIDTTQPYSLDNDVHILRTVLSRCGVTGPIVFVGHSYGGAIALVAADGDARFKGLVLVDALVPGVWTQEEVQKTLKTMRAQYDEIRKESPALAKVAIPWAEVLPQTTAELNATRVAESLPITDIMAEKGQSDPENARIWRRGHIAFTTGHAARRFILAEGSSHKVMRDKPDLVVDSILAMVKQTAR